MSNGSGTSATPIEAVVVSDVESKSVWPRARVAFWVLTVGCGLLGAAVVAPWRNPLIGLVVGAG